MPLQLTDNRLDSRLRGSRQSDYHSIYHVAFRIFDQIVDAPEFRNTSNIGNVVVLAFVEYTENPNPQRIRFQPADPLPRQIIVAYNRNRLCVIAAGDPPPHDRCDSHTPCRKPSHSTNI